MSINLREFFRFRHILIIVIFLTILTGAVSTVAQTKKDSKAENNEVISGLKGDLIPARDNAIEVAGNLKLVYKEQALGEVNIKYSNLRKAYLGVTTVIADLMRKGGDKKIVEALKNPNSPTKLKQKVDNFMQIADEFASFSKDFVAKNPTKGTDDKKSLLDKIEDFRKVIPNWTTTLDTVIKFIESKLPSVKRAAAAAAFTTETAWTKEWNQIQVKSDSQTKPSE